MLLICVHSSDKTVIIFSFRDSFSIRDKDKPRLEKQKEEVENSTSHFLEFKSKT